MSNRKDEEIIAKRICTKENPFRPGIDDTTHTNWTHENVQLDQYDMFATCPNCGVSWQEMYKDT